MVASSEPAVSHLITQAEALASRRHEELRGVHLLAALGAIPGAIRDALEEHRAGFRRILDEWERHIDQGSPDNLQLLRRRVREVSRTFGARQADAPHLLLALLDDTHGSARRMLGQLQVDVASLRSLAVQIGQGLPTRTRRSVTSESSRASQILSPSSAPRGEAVPVMPREPVRAPRVPQPEGVLTGHSASSANGSAASTGGRRSSPGSRSSGQALPVIPQVGPTPLPSQRLRARDGETQEHGSGDETLDELESKLLELAQGRPESGVQFLEEEPSDEGASALAPEAEAKIRARLELSKKKFPILTQVGRNLSLAAALKQADPVVGRDDEVEQALDVLAKRQGNNPCLVGAAGVGKTSVARGIADVLVQTSDEERIVVEIPISELLAGTGVRGALAGRLNALKKEVKLSEGRVILFFDEIHQLFSGDASEEIAGDLKLTLARGELPCIGATTTDEYRRYIEGDATLSRRFTAVEIEEPGREDAFLVLSSLAPRLEKHHQVTYDEEALALSIAWSVRYLPGRCLPDKAVGILDLAGARSRRRGFENVNPEAVAQVVASQANMPIERLLESDSERMLSLEEILCDRVIGHEKHLSRIARILRRNAAGLGGRRPIGTFLLLGPTGVGKTETAKAIAEVLFHSESAMTRIDMAEMSEAHAVAKLVGAPPGYVGHDAGGQLTEAVRRRPYQVVLLDEIEKAHPEVLTAFLAVFDEGRMTDSRGRLVDFTNTVLILTSNLGAGEIASSSRKRVGFSNDSGATLKTDDLVVSAARRALPPELYNRIDEVLPFAPLTRPDVMRIGRKMCQGLIDEVELSRGVTLQVADSAIEVLLESGGFEPELGARPLRRTLARQIEAPLAEALLGGELASGDTWLIDGIDGELSFDVIAGKTAGAAE